MPNPIFADSCPQTTCPPTLTLIDRFVPLIVNTLLGVSIVGFFFMLVLNGFTFMTTMGDTEKINQTRKSLGFSILGFVLIIASSSILASIHGLLGTKTGAVAYSKGNVNLKITSSFTATPIPENLVSHYKPTPYLTPPPAVPPNKGQVLLLQIPFQDVIYMAKYPTVLQMF